MSKIIAFAAYCWHLVRHSLHWSLKLLEAAEAIAATACYAIAYFWPQYHFLEIVAVWLIAVIVLTFFVGLLVAAFVMDTEKTAALKVAIPDQASRRARVKLAILADDGDKLVASLAASAGSSDLTPTLQERKECCDAWRREVAAALTAIDPQYVEHLSSVGPFRVAKFEQVQTILRRVRVVLAEIAKP